MKVKLKRYDIVPLVLFVYLCVMVYLGYPDYVAGATSPLLYYGGTAFTLLVIVLLRFNLKKRDRYRRERKADMEKKNNERTQNANRTDEKNEN